MRIAAVAVLGFNALALPALAQPTDGPAYFDDRSSPQALIRSLYNAINRKEFGRAWSYFAMPPSGSVEAYANGYADSDSVRLVVGNPAMDGAAGSVYYTLPVAIAARGTDGDEHVFAGCYTMRLPDPLIQSDGFQPLRIERGRFAPADGRPEQALPASCPGAPDLPPQNALVEKARARFQASRSDDCDGMGQEQPQSYEIEFRHATSSADEPPSKRTLVRFFCGRGAYNEKHVYYLADSFGEVR